MSSKNSKDDARLIALAVRMLDGVPVSASGDQKTKAIKLAIERLCDQLDEVRGAAAGRTFRSVRRFLGSEAFRPVLAAAPISYWGLKKRCRAEKARRQRQLATIGRATLSLFDTIVVDGQPVGDVWYSQLEGIRSKGTFEASVCAAILAHGRPAVDTQVRDMMREDVLSRIVASARKAAA